jgi:threonine dehydratase
VPVPDAEVSREVSQLDVAAATHRIAGRVRRTPVLEVTVDGRPVRLKLEFLQHTGSFKARGAFNHLLAAAEADALPRVGVVAASGGNAGLAFAYAAGQLGVPAEVFLPASAPAVKVRRLHALGARVVQGGAEYAAAYQAAADRQAETGALFCHPYDQPEVVAGQGTLGVELADQLGDELDTVLVAVGGGGLLAGVATALAGTAAVVGVEPFAAATLYAALEAGGPADVPVGGVAADSLGARRVGRIAYRVVTRYEVGTALVTDEAIVAARRWLWDRCRIAVEHGAAAPLAALASGAYLPERDERVAVVLCGANTDPSDLAADPDPAG